MKQFLLPPVALTFLSINVLIFCIFYPTIETKAKLGDQQYYIVSQIDPFGNGDDLNVFYKCGPWSFICTNLTDAESNDAIVVDKEKEEVSLIDIGELVYTDG